MGIFKFDMHLQLEPNVTCSLFSLKIINYLGAHYRTSYIIAIINIVSIVNPREAEAVKTGVEQ